MNEKIVLPGYVDEIIRRIELCGYNGYIVGGCVRDSLMGITPHDYDITTDSTPDETALCLDGYRIIRTGLKHGTMTVVAAGGNVEITTHRVDGEYSDNRHPDKVTFTNKLENDLNRRDFTINAMAYSNHTGIVDFNSGRRHIKEKIIMCVGDGDKRFREDGLRILRALRFAGVLGFAIEEETDKAIHRNKKLLHNISAERIFSELFKLLCGKDAGRILCTYSEIIGVIIPEILRTDMYRLNDIYNNTETDKYVRLALLFCGTENPAADAECVLRRLRACNNTIQTIKELLNNLLTDIGTDKRQIKRLLSILPSGRIRQLFNLRRAVLFDCYDKLKEIDAAEELLNNIEAEKSCVSLKSLAVNGVDLIEIGIKKGPDVGRILRQLLEMVIDGKIENDKEILLSIALELI
jgi:tRNA nucleotidyltransferase (CCA-adding enzyme)